MAVRRPLRDRERPAGAPSACRGAAHCSSEGDSVCSLRVWSPWTSVIATTSSAATGPPSGARRCCRRAAPELRVRLQGQPVRGRRRRPRLLRASRFGMPTRDPANHPAAAKAKHPPGAQGPPQPVRVGVGHPGCCWLGILRTTLRRRSTRREPKACRWRLACRVGFCLRHHLLRLNRIGSGGRGSAEGRVQSHVGRRAGCGTCGHSAGTAAPRSVSEGECVPASEVPAGARLGWERW